MDVFLATARGIIDELVKTLPDPVTTTITVLAGDKIFPIIMVGETTNSSRAKEKASEMARKLVKEHNAEAVLVSGDMLFTQVSTKDPSLIKRIDAIGIEAAHELGLVKRREALWCNIETRTQGKKALYRFYRRENDGRDIIVEEEWQPPVGAISMGRMLNFFE
jgi:hypothetical protein